MLQDLCKVGKLDTSKLFAGGDGEEEEREEKVTVGKLKLVNWEANKEESGEVKREVVKVILRHNSQVLLTIFSLHIRN